MQISASPVPQIEFTIVTVTFNCEDSIEKTMKSVFCQTYTQYEYIIIDGKSTDRTTEIIRKYADKLTTFVSEKDRGIYDAMNKGAALARGKWILFLNSGDVLADASVLEKVAQRTAITTSDIIYGDIFVRKHGNLIIREASEPTNKHRMYFCHQSAFTRTVLIKTNPFDLRFKLSADFYFFKQCYYQNFRFEHLSLPLVIYDLTGISNTNRLAGLTENLRIIKLLDKGWIRYKHLFHLYPVIFRLKMVKILDH